MARIPDVNIHFHFDDEKAQRLIWRLRERNHALEGAVSVLNDLVDQMAALDTVQQAEIDALKTQRDDLNAEIEDAKVKLDAEDLDPAFPAPPIPPTTGEP